MTDSYLGLENQIKESRHKEVQGMLLKASHISILSYFFRPMMEYHSVTLYWIVVTCLGLLLSDMLVFMDRIGQLHLGNPPTQWKVEHHCTEVMSYELNVIRSICYVTLPQSRKVAPFFQVVSFASAFQLSVARFKVRIRVSPRSNQ